MVNISYTDPKNRVSNLDLLTAIHCGRSTLRQFIISLGYFFPSECVAYISILSIILPDFFHSIHPMIFKTHLFSPSPPQTAMNLWCYNDSFRALNFFSPLDPHTTLTSSSADSSEMGRARTHKNEEQTRLFWIQSEKEVDRFSLSLSLSL